MPIVFSEFFENYEKLCKGISVQKSKTTSFIEYINWINNQDKKEAEEYWADYLAAYEEKVVIPSIKNTEIKNEYKNETVDCIIDKNTTEKLSILAKQNKVTLNTLFQAVWGILLQRYNNTDDVVFGNILSSRPPEIDGIEEMVGIFINAVPVRIKVEKDITFEELIIKVQEQAINSEKYSYLPLAQIQTMTILKNELIDHLMVFENYPMEQIQKENNEYRITSYNVCYTKLLRIHFLI